VPYNLFGPIPLYNSLCYIVTIKIKLDYFMDLKLDEALKLAKKKLKEGYPDESKRIYWDILRRFPANKKAKRGLKSPSGSPIDKSQKVLNPPQDQQQLLINLYSQGQLQQALDRAKGLLKQFPYSILLHNICGAVYAAFNQYDAAIDSYKHALKIKPDYAEAHNNMGNALKEKGELNAAIDSYKQAFKIKPDYAEAHNNIGNALKEKGELNAAIDSYKQAFKIKPDYAEAHNNIGNALKEKGELNAAIDSFKQALKIKPDHAEIHSNMGIALQGQGELNAAIDSYKQALKIKPDYAEAHNNMGCVLQDMGEQDAAIDSYKQALKIKPDYAEAHNNMGNALKEKGELNAAIDSFKQALKIKPDYAEAHKDMGSALKEKGELNAAIDSYKQALKINPDYQSARSLKLYNQAHICDWAAIQADHDLVSKLGITTQYIPPFSILSFEDAPEHHRLRSKLYVKSKLTQKPLPLAQKPLQKPKRLRIGYFSADFHNHATMYLMARIFEAHDPEKFEIYAYSFGPDKNDAMRQRLIKAVDVFRDVGNMSDKDATLLARQDKIDIAVDLKGYTKHSRPGIFSYQAAPLQISYLGYPGTMGAGFIDYIIADKVVITEPHEKYYTENIMYLPNSYQVNDNTRIISDCSVTKSEMGLPEHGFVFCCFNSNYKISPDEFEIWMRILGMVEGSVLWLLKSNKWAEKNLQLEAESRGISRDRLIFADKIPHDEHLARHRLADLFVDTFNYNAHTTSSDALWAGLPVVTKLGNGFAARVAGSLLTAIGLPELITETEQEYEALILDLATNQERLASLKDKLAANRLSKPLFDTELFTKHLEDGYQQAYQRYFEGLKPDTIRVCN
jgi:protein O-GlcNAc transferase